jgi:cytochrome c-type biogenesis protein CcmH
MTGTLRIAVVRLAGTALLALAVGLSAAAEAPSLSADPALEARVMAVAEELRCLVCQNETIAASQAELAVDLRKQIRTKLQQGQSEAQILEFMTARYGEFVRYRPAFSPTNALLWAGPFLLLAVAAVVMIRNIRRRRALTVAAPLDAEETRRLRALLSDGAAPR